MNLLFICSRNQWRSPTAEEIYRKDTRVHAQSAGLGATARRCVSEKLLRWADLILVMEHSHKRRLRAEFPDLFSDLQIRVLDIPDDYPFMAPELIELLYERVEPWLEDSIQAQNRGE